MRGGGPRRPGLCRRALRRPGGEPEISFVPQTLEAAQAQLLLEVAQEASGLAAERIRIAVFP